MQVLVELNDARRILIKSNQRYACVRLTIQGGFIVKKCKSAEECVKFAKNHWKANGYNYLVMDTHSGEAIAFYPCVEKNWLKGHAPPTRSCDECGGGWTKINGGEWIPDHVFLPEELRCSQLE